MDMKPPGILHGWTLAFWDSVDTNRVPAGSQLLINGAAASIWLVDAPDVAERKCIFKVVRLSMEVLKVKCNARASTYQGSQTAEELWGEFTSRFKSKLDQWKPLAHENLVRILGIGETFGIYTEYLAGGTASEYLARHPNDSVPLRKRMDKLFVDNYGTTKIGEFGLASLVEGFEPVTSPISQRNQIRWWGPELLRSKPKTRTLASDIWALGCTLFEILSGKLPYFRHSHELLVYHELVTNVEDLLDPDFAQAWASVTSCWELIPEQRPLARDLWEHYPFRASVLLSFPIERDSHPISHYSGNTGV